MSADWDIEALDYDELLALNRHVVERIRHLQSLQSQYLMFELHLGQRVRFDAGPEHGGRLLATVVKRNRKTVGLVTDDGRQWRVSPHLVTPPRTSPPRSRSRKSLPKAATAAASTTPKSIPSPAPP